MSPRDREAMLIEILKRKEDYTEQRLERERAELISLWQAAYPDAVKEPAAHLHPLILVEKVTKQYFAQHRLQSLSHRHPGRIRGQCIFEKRPADEHGS